MGVWGGTSRELQSGISVEVTSQSVEHRFDNLNYAFRGDVMVDILVY